VLLELNTLLHSKLLVPVLAFFPMLFSDVLPLCSAKDASVAIVDAGVQQSEDGAFVSDDYRFLPGDFVYFTFQIAGFQIKSESRDEIESRKISLHYEITPEDMMGTPLAPPNTGDIQTELSPEDKNWTPKRRAAFLLPGLLAAGQFRVHVVVQDMFAKSETSRDYPFHVGGIKIDPSASITVENFEFFRTEREQAALEIPAYSAGDFVYARFDMAGYKLGPQNQYHLGYGLKVLRPDGKVFIEQANAAELNDGSFYPAQFVPGNLKLSTPHDVPHGEYVIVLTVRDLVANQSYETKKAFSIE